MRDVTDRVPLRTDGGRTVLTYEAWTTEDRPGADAVELADGVTLDDAVAALLTQLPGAVVSGDDSLLEALLAAGARPRRYAHTYSWDLRGEPPPPAWATLPPADGVRVEPAEGRAAQDLLPGSAAAYPASHVDGGRDATDDLRGILAGTVVGPLLGCSEVALDPARAGEVVAALLVNDSPTSGPWVTDVFRRPEPRYAGLGALLLRRGLAQLAGEGRASLGLAVTDGNPARSFYERLGFRHTGSFRTVYLPDAG